MERTLDAGDYLDVDTDDAAEAIFQAEGLEVFHATERARVAEPLRDLVDRAGVGDLSQPTRIDDRLRLGPWDDPVVRALEDEDRAADPVDRVVACERCGKPHRIPFGQPASRFACTQCRQPLAGAPTPAKPRATPAQLRTALYVSLVAGLILGVAYLVEWAQCNRFDGELAARGAEADKRRPAIVVSNHGANASATRLGRGVVAVVPVTSNTSPIAGWRAVFRFRCSVPRISSMVRNTLTWLYCVLTTACCFTYGPTT